MPAWTRALLPALLAATIGNAQTTAPPVDPTLQGAALFAATCAACHGEKGQGNEMLKAPSIAAQPAWHVLNQLAHFREKRRGTDPADPQGMLMAAVASALNPKQARSVAAHIESLPRAQPQPVASDEAGLREGRWLYETRCMECHRFNGSGELAFASPPLIGLQGWYLEAQLEKFRTGTRGAADGDELGAKMRLAASFIENEKQLRDLVAYILTLNPPPESDPFQ